MAPPPPKPTIPAKAPAPTQRPNKHQTNKNDAALFVRSQCEAVIQIKRPAKAGPAPTIGLTSTTEEVNMVEAIHSLTQAQRLAQRQAQAVRVLCERRAQEEIKDQIRRQGKIKLSKVPRRDIVRLARVRLFEDAEYRSRLIAEARLIVEEWRREGYFGKAAQGAAGAQDKEKWGGPILVEAVQHSQDLHSAGSAEPQALPLCETHDRNGAVR